MATPSETSPTSPVKMGLIVTAVVAVIAAIVAWAPWSVSRWVVAAALVFALVYWWQKLKDPDYRRLYFASLCTGAGISASVVPSVTAWAS